MVSFGKSKRPDTQSLLGPNRGGGGGIFRNIKSKTGSSDRSDSSSDDRDATRGGSGVNILGLSPPGYSTPTKPTSSASEDVGISGGAGGGGSGGNVPPRIMPRFTCSSNNNNNNNYNNMASTPDTSDSETPSPKSRPDQRPEIMFDDVSEITAIPESERDRHIGGGGRNDPPGRMVHTRSDDAKLVTGSSGDPEGGGVVAANSLVHNFLSMMDKACVATPQPDHNGEGGGGGGNSVISDVSPKGLSETTQKQLQTKSFVDLIEGAITPVPDAPAKQESVPDSAATSDSKQEPYSTPNARDPPFPVVSKEQLMPSYEEKTDHYSPMKHENFEMILQERSSSKARQDGDGKHQRKGKISLKKFAFGGFGSGKKERQSPKSRHGKKRSPNRQKGDTKFRRGRSSSPARLPVPRTILSGRFQDEEKKEEDSDRRSAAAAAAAAALAASPPPPPPAPKKDPYYNYNAGKATQFAASDDDDDTPPPRASPPPPLTRPLRGKRATTSSPKTSAPAAATKAQKEARYKHLLGALMSMSHRTPLETVAEESGSDADSWNNSYSRNNEATELKVRVPGLVHPDAFISDKDLLSDEVSQSHYDVSLYAIDATPKQKSGDNSHAARATSSHQITRENESASAPVTPPKKKVRPEIERISPEASSPIQRSQTWIEKLGLNKILEDERMVEQSMSADEADILKKSRQIGSNYQFIEDDKASEVATKSSKPVWKAAKCPTTGRTYYYHRLTRKTTWTKPSDEELLSTGRSDATGEDDRKRADSSMDDDGNLRKKSLRDFDPSVWKTKQDIVQLLKTMSPPDGATPDALLIQYEGREDELLLELKDMDKAETQPFDEPAHGEPSTDNGNINHVEDPSTVAGSSRALDSRVRTQNSHYSGFSSGLMSASTRQIKNTGRGRRFLRKDAIPETESHATSISSKMGYMLPPAKGLQNSGNQGSPARVPSNIPVPRTRDLVVEDFSSERYTRAETFGMKGVVRAKETPRQKDNHFSPLKIPEATAYYGDGEDTDTKDTDTISLPNDSISALSEADISYLDRKEAYDQARRRALDEAIAREDWDLAAALSEGMRTLKAKNAHGSGKDQEWTQTELDRFISENDWDAVANYIAHVRDEAKNVKSKSTGSSRKKGQRSGTYRPEKRFGAKSQLQHKELSYEDYDDSWDSRSESSFESYSSVSSYTDEEPFRYNNRKKKNNSGNVNFAC